MPKMQKITLTALRVSFGFLFLYSAITKITDPGWSAFGYLTHAQNFQSLFAWLSGPVVLPVVNFLNVYGQLALGVSLLLGLFVRWSGIFGAGLMLLYYLALPFPQVDAHSYVVDQHIIYGFTLLLLSGLSAGQVFGLDKYIKWRKA